jgi:predicted Rossmann fold flavoprotein
MKNIVLVGGGVTNCLLSILLKQYYKDNVDVLIIEKNDTLLKKLTITGNGKCNILNKNYIDGLIIDNLDIKKSFESITYFDLKKFYDEIGLILLEKGDLIYPFNESANQTRDYLVEIINRLGVKVHNNELFLSYKKLDNKYEIITNNSKISADLVVFSTGGKSYKVLGADDSVLKELINHSYKISEFIPGLCAIKVKENVKRLDGTRVKAKVSVFNNNKVVFEESGEVLFKKDGLSGIVIFNTSLFIAKNFSDFKNLKISLNLIEDLDIENVVNFEKYSGSAAFLNVVTQKKVAEYINFNYKDQTNIVEILKNLTFTPTDFYGFDNAQISVGGIKLDNLTNSLESKFEENIYFGGELLDISGYCGGYNLSMCLASALIILKNITKED